MTHAHTRASGSLVRNGYRERRIERNVCVCVSIERRHFVLMRCGSGSNKCQTNTARQRQCQRQTDRRTNDANLFPNTITHNTIRGAKVSNARRRFDFIVVIISLECVEPPKLCEIVYTRARHSCVSCDIQLQNNAKAKERKEKRHENAVKRNATETNIPVLTLPFPAPALAWKLCTKNTSKTHYSWSKTSEQKTNENLWQTFSSPKFVSPPPLRHCVVCVCVSASVSVTAEFSPSASEHCRRLIHFYSLCLSRIISTLWRCRVQNRLD